MKYLLASLLLISGCSNTISAEKINWANKVCENAGGVSKVYGKVFAGDKFRATCKDGAYYHSNMGLEGVL